MLFRSQQAHKKLSPVSMRGNSQNGGQTTKSLLTKPQCSGVPIQPSECLFLGDTNVDIFTAKNAGMTSVGVLWGFRTRNELVQAGADYIAENPHVILQLIGR